MHRKLGLIQFGGHFREADTMSSMADQKPKRGRRSFAEESKGAVRLVLDENKSVGAAAPDLDLTESSLRNSVEQPSAERGAGRAGVLTTSEREQLGRLRKEARELRMERDVLKRPRPLSRTTNCSDK
jgi:transposase